MDKKMLLGALALMLVITSSCSSDDGSSDRGNWKERSVFDGIPRSNAASFLIGDKAYMGTGYDGDDYLNDFWEYNIEGDYWSQKANFPGIERSSSSAFAIDNKGYLGIGYDGDNELSDFWEYNPNSNTWTQKANFGGGNRRDAVGFASNTNGYIGTGHDGDNDKKDFWKYNPSQDEWEELVGFGGDKRKDASTFIINDEVYLVAGVSNGLYKDDFWKFNPQTELWTRLQDIDYDDDNYIFRSNAVGLTINGLGYLVSGYNVGALSSTWEYNPLNDEWEEITPLEGYARQDATGFSYNNRGFVLLGRNGSLYLDDNYELFPQEEYDDED